MENIADILRNAPEGIELYSTSFGECKLSYVIENEITIEYFDGKNPDFVTLDQDGKFMPNGSCILFPDNSTDSWVYWQERLFRKDESIGYVIIDTHLEGFWIIGKHYKSMCLYDSAGGHMPLRDCNLSNCRYATKEEVVKFFEKVGENNCYWDNKEKAILENTKKEEFIEEPKNNSKFKDGDIVTVVKHNNGWTDYLIGIVIGPYIFGSDLSKISINKALLFEIRYATEIEKHKFVKEFLIKWKEPKESLDIDEEPKELYTDEEAKEFASKISHEWWQMVMDWWNTLTEDEKKKYNQFIGFNDFSDHLMNILRSVLLGLKRNGKLIYEEGSLFIEPDQKIAEIELDETPIPCYEPKYFSCTGNCGYCVYHTTTGCSKKIEYDKSGCVSSGNYNSACESDISSGEYYSAYATKNNKYVPKLKVGDKACLSDKNDNIYFEEILKVNDEEYYTKTFGWINCKAIDELHEINFKEYNKPFTINEFKPFDKVLWRLGPTDIWSIGFFDTYYIAGENDEVSYSVLGYEKDWVPQCIPYNIDTAYLHDTDKEYDGKYKTW